MKLNLANKLFLIIEDYPVMRKSMKDMLYTLGAQTIYEAENGDAAISVMQKIKFDIVLCDYNLGHGKNGQQILEEARYYKLISFNTIFIIVTAHQTTSFVLNTIEYKPDEYLAKPFNPQQLLRRLEKSEERKKVLSGIEKEIDQGNLARAISLCENLLSSDNKINRSQLLKIRADLAIRVSDFKKATDIYQQILEQRELSWARLGTAIIAFLKNEYQQSITILLDLIKHNSMLMESYDWLAKAYQALGKTTEAEETLILATEISPHSLSRQKNLAILAEKNGHLDIAEKAYLATTHLSQFSIHKTASDFSSLAKVYSKKNDAKQAFKALNEMRQQYHTDTETELRVSTVETEILFGLGDIEQSKQAFQKVQQLRKQLKTQASKDLQLDMAKACYRNDEEETAANIISSLINNHIDDNDFIDEIRQMHSEIGHDNCSELLIEETKNNLVKINNQGVELFKKGQIKEALAIFQQAIEKMPDNKTIIFNLLKITLHDLKTSGVTKETLLLAHGYLKKAKLVGVSASKLGKLQLEFEKLTKSYTTTQK